MKFEVNGKIEELEPVKKITPKLKVALINHINTKPLTGLMRMQAELIQNHPEIIKGHEGDLQAVDRVTIAELIKTGALDVTTLTKIQQGAFVDVENELALDQWYQDFMKIIFEAPKEWDFYSPDFWDNQDVNEVRECVDSFRAKAKI